MPYHFNTSEDQQAMLQAIGATDLNDLFSVIPDDIKFQGLLNIQSAMSEIELAQHLERLAAKNDHVGNKVCFLGGGAYDHFIPAAVDMIASRGEFYTSYTPYQPEVSQGNLQAMFEYQSMICQLTGMDVSNASVYDGGTATIEGTLMCMDATKRKKAVLLGTVHPEYRMVVETYLVGLNSVAVTIPCPAGVVDLDLLRDAVDNETACIVVQHPNFFGTLENVEGIVEIARQQGAHVVQIFDPMSLGILKSPGELGADIAVAEGQCLGNPLAYGGPYLGIVAARDSFIRRMPGRIAGQTISQNNQRCFVLTLQTREQHIRRDKATSNICTNQTLFALRATIYLSLMGPEGMRELGELCVKKANYAAKKITEHDRFELAFQQPFFKEFVIRDRAANVDELLSVASAQGFMAGVSLAPWYDELSDCFLVAVTEKRTQQEIDQFAKMLAGIATTSEAMQV